VRSVPRDISADEPVRRLQRLGYYKSKQEGSHISCVRTEGKRHRVIVPRHKVGTLQDIIKRIAAHLELAEDGVLEQFGL